MGEQMTARERVRTVFDKRLPDRVPVFPVITPVHASRILRRPIRDFYLDSELKFEALLAAQDFYGFDGFELGLSGPRGARTAASGTRDGRPVLLDGNGKPIAYLREDDDPIPIGKREPLMKTLADVEKIGITPYQRYLDLGMTDGIRRVRKLVGDGAYLAGTCAGQTMNSLVAYMGSEAALFALYDEPELVCAVMDRVTDNLIEQLKAFKEAGVDGIYFGDAWSSASVISPEQFKTFCVPRYRRFVEAVHALGLQCYIHVCGNAVPLFELMADTGTDGIEPLDPLGGVSVADAKKRVGSRVALKGGVDTLAFLDSAEKVYALSKEVLEEGAPGGGFILGSGDDIPRDAKPEAVLAMVRAAKEYRY